MIVNKIAYLEAIRIHIADILEVGLDYLVGKAIKVFMCLKFISQNTDYQSLEIYLFNGGIKNTLATKRGLKINQTYLVTQC